MGPSRTLYHPSPLILYLFIITSLFFVTNGLNNEHNRITLSHDDSGGGTIRPLSVSSSSSSSSVLPLSSSSSSSASLSTQPLSSTATGPRQLSCVKVNVTSPYKYQIYPTGFIQRVTWSAGCYMPSDLIDIELYYHDADLKMDAFVSVLVTGWNATQGYWDWAVPEAVPIAGADSFQFKINFFVSPGGHSNRAIGQSPIFIISKYIPPRYPYAEVAGITLGALTLCSCILCFLGWRFCKPGCCYYPVIGKTREYIKRKLQERKQRKLAAKKRIEAEIERKKQEALLAEAAKLSFGLWGTPAYVEPRLPPKRVIFPPVSQANDDNGNNNIDEEDRIIIGFTEDGQPKFGVNSQHHKKRTKKGVKRGRGGRNRSSNGREYVQANNGSSDEEPPRTEAEAQAKAARMRVEAARRFSANGYPTNDNSDSGGDILNSQQPMIMIDNQSSNSSSNNNNNEETELSSISTFHGTTNASPNPVNNASSVSSSARSISLRNDATWASPGTGMISTSIIRDKLSHVHGHNLPPLGNNSGYYDSDHSSNTNYSYNSTNQPYDNEGRINNTNHQRGYNSSSSKTNYDNLSQPSMDDELSSVGGRAIHLEYGTGERYGNDIVSPRLLNQQQQQQPSQLSQSSSFKSPSSSSNYPGSSASSTQGDSLDEHTQQYSYGSRKPSAGYYNNVSSPSVNTTTNTNSFVRNHSASTGRPPRTRPLPGPSDDFLRTALGPYDGDDYVPPVRGHITGYHSETGSLQSFDGNNEQSMFGVPDNLHSNTANTYGGGSSSGTISGRSSANRRNYSNNNNSAYPMSNDNRYFSDHSGSDGGIGGGNESSNSISANNSPRPAFVRGNSGNTLPMPRMALDTLNSGSTAGDAFLISTPSQTRPASGSYLPSSTHTSSFRSPPGTSGRSTAGKTGAAVIYS